MTKEEKIAGLSKFMTRSKRDAEGEREGEEFYHFTDEAPEELKDIFLEHYNVKDIDYETFSRALDIVSEIYADGADDVVDEIYQRAPDSASVYNGARLAYLDAWNEEEISQLMREYGEHSIATACALWYDKQVENASCIIDGWITK